MTKKGFHHTETIKRDPREIDEAYLAWIRTQSCCVCRRTPAEPHHIRVASIVDGKLQTGLGRRSSDKWALPLCRDCHNEAHSESEDVFWAKRGINPFVLSMSYRRSR
jgi:hypothetical protein